LEEAWNSEASGPQGAGDGGLFHHPVCSARSASSRCEAMGTRRALPSQDKANPPSTFSMNLPCDPGQRLVSRHDSPGIWRPSIFSARQGLTPWIRSISIELLLGVSDAGHAIGVTYVTAAQLSK
jgi:hypothetical protein